MDMLKSKKEDYSRLYYKEAREWWDDYLQIRPSHSSRLVKLIATGEFGNRSMVTDYVFPIQSEFINTPREAARFVSLFDIDKSKLFGDVR
jgi:centrosomal protein CEP76